MQIHIEHIDSHELNGGYAHVFLEMNEVFCSVFENEGC
jgi:hypothetical protein